MGFIMKLKMLQEQIDDRYIAYQPIDTFMIFQKELDKDETEMYEILIESKQDIEKLEPVVSKYINWLNNCESEIRTHIVELIGESLPDSWMDDMEIYSASIVFNSAEDYGATISFSACEALGDCVVEVDFDKEKIAEVR